MGWYEGEGVAKFLHGWGVFFSGVAEMRIGSAQRGGGLGGLGAGAAEARGGGRGNGLGLEARGDLLIRKT
jgi:hypothetical protein